VQIDEEAAENEDEDPGNVSETGSADGGQETDIPTNLTSPRMMI
jgi:hypothetical protein